MPDEFVVGNLVLVTYSAEELEAELPIGQQVYKTLPDGRSYTIYHNDESRWSAEVEMFNDHAQSIEAPTVAELLPKLTAVLHADVPSP